MIYKYAFGGIGDMLQCMQSAIEAGTIDVFSHYEKAPDVFEPFGIKINRFEHFNQLDFFIGSQPLERHFYPRFKMPDVIFSKCSGKTVGIHIEGSKFSNDFGSLGICQIKI